MANSRMTLIKKFLMRNWSIALLVIFSLPAQAITVFDPSNFAQNVQQVARAVTQIQNQITQINQMSQSLQSIGNSQYSDISNGLNTQLTQMRNTLGRLSSISQSVATIEGEFRTLFPDENSWQNYDYSAHQNTLKTWSTEIDNATIEAFEAQAITSRAASNVAQVQALLAQSQLADGEVRQLQLMNQNMAVLSQQMNDSLQLLTANGRLQALETARQAKSREAARTLKTRMLNNLGTATYDAPVRTHLP